MEMPKKIAQCQKIVEEHQCAAVEKVLVDACTANAVVTVWKALNETNKAKLVALPTMKMCELAWKMVA